MRFAFAAALTGLALLCVPSPVRAEADPANTTAVQPRHPLIPTILGALAARGETVDDPAEAAWVSELLGFYAAAGTEPLWVGAQGLSPRGAGINAEIRQSDQYGLDPTKFDLPQIMAGVADAATLGAAEAKISLAAAKYVWHARGGRVDPATLSLWLDQSPRVVYASRILQTLSDSSDPALTLRAEHPRHPQFELLRQALLKARGGGPPEEPAPVIAPGPKIVSGDHHPDVVLVRRRLGLRAGNGDDTLFDDELADGVNQFMREEAGVRRKWVIDDAVRAAMSQSPKSRPGSEAAWIAKILVNMERWRWVPEDFGPLHVWNNLPEFETRVVKGGEVIHRERIIIGQPHTQTPVFSNTMRRVIFQPTWGLPPSIKVHQFGNRGDIGGTLERRNMKIVDDDGTVIRSSRINWGKVDIRNVPIVQGPGPGNPLGRLKFVFPNAHDVYMHDTPDKDLFSASVRTFSHGCIRVHNPERLAEVILGETRGWTPADVKRQLAIKDTLQVDLLQQVQVHNTYFTIVADEAGGLRSLNDVYGHDKRIGDALAGKPIDQIAANDPALAQLRENQELAKRGAGGEAKRSRYSRYADSRYSEPTRPRVRNGQPKSKPLFNLFKTF